MAKLATLNHLQSVFLGGLKSIFFFFFLSLFAISLQANPEYSTNSDIVLGDCYHKGGDTDQDGICDDYDNCVDTYNPLQSDYDNDGIGDVCDDAHDCDKITSIRRVLNLASACSGADDRVIWFNGAYCREIGDLYFIEYDNGTAKLTGRVQEVDGSNISIVDVTFTGKTTNGSPYIGCAGTDHVDDWYYYADFSGTIGGMNIVPNPNHNFQVGFGANVKNDLYGASGWFTLDGIATDFNFDLSDPLPCASGSIGNRVWEDKNGNGIQDDGDTGIAGVFIFLEDIYGNSIPGVMYQVSGTDGEYLFEDLPYGNYVVKFATPTGYTLTDADKGGDDSADSDASFLDGRTPVITLNDSNKDDLSIDAGYFFPTPITGYVWHDVDQNGIQDDIDSDIEGVKVTLYFAGADLIPGTSDDERVNDILSDNKGFYSFPNAAPGKYFVNFDLSTLSEDYIFTAANQGGDDFSDSDANEETGNSHVFMVISGIPYTGVDAGLLLKARLPVELISFTAGKLNCFTQLEWVSGAEENFSHFELEYSSNRDDFKNIDLIGAEGGRGIQNYYSVHKNTAEVNYYRLKMVDLDGTYEYSDILYVKHDCNANAGMSIFPNPVSQHASEVSVKFFSTEENTNIHVIDGMGRVIRSIPVNVELEWNVENLEVSELPAGIYYIMIDGNRQTAKFIITE